MLRHWTALELDLADQGIDLDDGILDRRTWRWLQVRVFGLIGNPRTRLGALLAPTPDSGGIARGPQRR